jgi:hypothetical protein
MKYNSQLFWPHGGQVEQGGEEVTRYENFVVGGQKLVISNSKLATNARLLTHPVQK